MTASTITRPGTRAEEAAAGLENLAAFIKAHPDLPLGEAVPLTFPVDFLACDLPEGADIDEANRAEVGRIAVILGTAPYHPNGIAGHWTASRDFGGGVVYAATAITRASYAEFLRTWTAARVLGKNAVSA
jgi:hypothetical protein